MLPFDLTSAVLPAPAGLRIEDLLFTPELLGLLEGYPDYEPEDGDDGYGNVMEYLEDRAGMRHTRHSLGNDGTFYNVTSFPDCNLHIDRAREHLSRATEYWSAYSLQDVNVADILGRIKFERIFAVRLTVDDLEGVKYLLVMVDDTNNLESLFRLRYNIDSYNDIETAATPEAHQYPIGLFFMFKPEESEYENVQIQGINPINGCGFNKEQLVYLFAPLTTMLRENPDYDRLIIATSCAAVFKPNPRVCVLSCGTGMPAPATQATVGFGHDAGMRRSSIQCPVRLSRVQTIHGTMVAGAYRSEEAVAESTALKTLATEYHTPIVPVMLSRDLIVNAADGAFVIGIALKGLFIPFAGKSLINDIAKPQDNPAEAARLFIAILRAGMAAAAAAQEVSQSRAKSTLDFELVKKTVGELIPRVVSHGNLSNMIERVNDNINEMEARLAAAYQEQARIAAMLDCTRNFSREVIRLEDVAEQLATSPIVETIHDLSGTSAAVQCLIESKPVVFKGSKALYNVGPLGIGLSNRGLLSIRTEKNEFVEDHGDPAKSSICLMTHRSNMIDYGAKLGRSVFELLVRARIEELLDVIMKTIKRCPEEEVERTFAKMPAEAVLDGCIVMDLDFKCKVEDDGKEQEEAHGAARSVEERGSLGDDVQTPG